MDQVNNRIGINTANPQFTIDANGTKSRVTYENTAGGVFQISGDTFLPRFQASAAPSATKPTFSFNFGVRTWDDTTFPGYGKIGDAFAYASNEANGLNIINRQGTGTTEDYIRFYAGQDANGTTPDIHIQGTGSTRGYVGINNTSPIEKLDVTGNINITGNLTLTGSVNLIPISRGGGNNAYNLAVGDSVLLNNTPLTGDTGLYNIGYGVYCLSQNTTGWGNTAIGYGNQVFKTTGTENTSLGFQPLFFDTLGYRNTAIGSRALYTLGNTQIDPQINNTAVGAYAGRYIANGTSPLSTASGSTFIGYNTKALANLQTNQIVIGNDAIGNGSNTTTIGNSNTNLLYLGGKAGEGIVLTSPDGTKYKLTIANGGTLSITAV